MENSVKQRLMLFLKAMGIRPSHFEKRCGFSNGYLASLKDRPSEERTAIILERYPKLNRIWLLTGEGDMLNGGTTVVGDNSVMAANIGGNNEQNGGKVIEVLSHQLDEKDRQIDRLLGIIEKLS